VRIRREKDVNSQLVVETIPPDFDTVVGEDGTVFDPQLVPSYLSLPIDICEGNFDGDRDQDGTDAFKFRTDFGRGLSYKPCPILSTTTTVPANYCPSDLAKCGSECIDTTTDESNCGGCGIICPGKCVGGTCQDECPPCPPVTQCVGTLSPLGRWCDQGNGTVKDMTTGLVWLKDAGWGGQKPWREPGDDTHNDDAHTRAGTLYDGMPGEPSDLSDGSVEGDWRLPTLSELKGITLGDEYIILSSQMYFFNNVRPGYWSSTTLASNTRDAWGVLMDLGSGYTRKDSSEIPGHYLYVWPVRGGQ
jgi:hypothetical protein